MDNPISLADIAQKVMIERGFQPNFPDAVTRELASIEAPATPSPQTLFCDMRDRLWISIDNDDSRDLDQLTFAETSSGKDKIYVAIADVDALVKKSSSIDQHAACNTTSVYTPAKVFPMLPLKLSTDLTSLNENSDRCAIVTEMEIDRDGRFELCSIYPCLVCNHAKLAYNSVAAWLEQKTSLPSLVNTSAILEQLRLQDDLAQRIRQYRYLQGSLTFGKAEVQPIIVNGLAVELKEKVHNRATSLIENFMIAANVGATRYLIKQKLPMIKRIVRTPQRWDRIVALAKDHDYKLPSQPDAKALRDFLRKRHQADPSRFSDLSLAVIKLIGKGEYIMALPEEPTPGHFDLALHDYTHATTPNRRYPDLITQRLLKSSLYGYECAYSKEELSSLAAHCTKKEDDASKVERRLYKSAAAMVLEGQIGHQFKAFVTGASEKGTWVRLLTPPVEGKLVHGFQGLDVGDYVLVKLIHVDIPNGYIDFARAR
jgi:exoribonuclease II